jgi:2-polyprenyl-6-methoxyphenol hydroxylase-like FAD-dependent oxidoreductase
MATMSSQQKPFLAGKRIIVAGASIAGLSFAIALRKQWTTLTSHHSPPLDPLTIVIYERDNQKLAADRDGYSLSIRSDPYSGGMQALHKLGLLEPMLRASLTGAKNDSGGFAVWDKDWTEILKFKARTSDSGLAVPSMRIARKALREILIDGVASDDVIHWGVSCTDPERLEDGKVQVRCSNGEVDECDILIAADGVNSRIRARLRPDDKLLFAGAVCISGQSTFSDAVPAPLNRDWGTVIGAGGVSLFASPVDEHSAVWSLSYLAPEPRERMTPPLTQEQAQQLKQEALDRGSAIAPPFESLMQATDISTLTIFNPRDKNPFPHVSGNQTCEPIIFIGDSNHAMSPFAGNGANMALMDGWELAEQLCNSSSLLTALTAYDSLSMPRSKSAIRMSHWTIAIAHAQGWKLTFYVLLLRIMKFLLFARG